MPKFLFSQVDWDSIEFVGFDLDGTLYDEYDFIAQVYQPIAERLSQCVERDAEFIYQHMLQRWLEKGSSYNKIFEEILLEASLSASETEHVISQCLLDFRNFQPQLQLTKRVETILEWLSSRFSLFLVTDGNYALQQAKISSMGLTRWFSPDNISISGYFPGKISKPDVRMISQIKILNSNKNMLMI